MKSRFLMCKKPLFYIQKGAFFIIMLREKTMASRLCSGGLQEGGSEESGICSGFMLRLGESAVLFAVYGKCSNFAGC